MRKGSRKDQIPAGLQLGSGFQVEICGFDRLPPAKQTEVLKGLQEALKECPTIEQGSAAGQTVSFALDKGACVVFNADPSGPLKLADELTGKLEKALFRVKIGGHVGSFQVTTDPDRRKSVTGELLHSLTHILLEAKPGQVLFSEGLAGIARQTPDFSKRIREIAQEHESDEKLYRLTPDDEGLELSSAKLQRWEGLAGKLYDRAKAKAKAKEDQEPASKLEIAERLAAIFRDAKVACVILFFAYLIHVWSEDTDAGRRLQLWGYQKLEGSLAAPAEGLRLTVVDFGQGLQNSDPEETTSMTGIANLITAVAKRKPASIGVDLDFGQLKDQTFAPDEEKVVAVAEDLTKKGIPVYLTVHRSIWQTPDSWLGDLKYAHLVAHPLVPLEPLTGQITLFDSLPVPHAEGQPADVPSMSSQLAKSIPQDPTKSTVFSRMGSFVVRHFTTPYAVSDLVDQEPAEGAPASLGKKYYANFASLPQLKANTIRAASAKELDSYPDIDQKIEGSAVLIGSSAPNADASYDDEWVDPNTGQRNAGVYLLAIGAETKAQAPLYEFKASVRKWLTISLSFAVVLGVILVRLFYIASPREIGESRLSLFMTVVVAVLTLVGGVVMVRTIGILWPDFFLIAFLLMLHPRIEHTFIHGWKWIGRSAKSAWGAIAFGEK